VARIQKVLNWFSDNLSESWLFMTAVFILWHPAFPERIQNGICVAGLLSVATALVRLKKLEHLINEIRAAQFLEEGRRQVKFSNKVKKSIHKNFSDDDEEVVCADYDARNE
jgi:hypothetical protein